MVQLFLFILDALRYVLQFYVYLLIAAVVLRLARADENSFLGKMVFTLTDPPARWLTRKFPKLVIYSSGSYIDLGPLVLLIGIHLIIMFIYRLPLILNLPV